MFSIIVRQGDVSHINATPQGGRGMIIDGNLMTYEDFRKYVVYSGMDENNEPYFELDFKGLKENIIRQLAGDLYEEKNNFN